MVDVTTNINSNGLDRDFNLLLLGDSGVGQTSLFEVILGKKVDNPAAYQAEMELDLRFGSQQVDVGKLNFTFYDGSSFAATDLPGLTQCICDANAIMLIYDITNEHSFLNLKNWIELVEQNNPEINRRTNQRTIMMVGNKLDLEEERQVSNERGLEFAIASRCFTFKEISAFAKTIGPDLRDGISLIIAYFLKASIAEANIQVEEWEEQQEDKENCDPTFHLAASY